MNDLKKLADALGHLCRGADLLAASRGLYERREGDLPRLDPYVTVTMSSYGAVQIDADVLLHDYTGDGADYRKVRVCSEHDVCDADNMEGYEFDKTVDGIYDRVFLDIIGRILDGKLAEAEEDACGEARLPLHLVRNHRTGKLDVVDDNSAVVASFAPDEVIDAETEPPLKAGNLDKPVAAEKIREATDGIEAEANVKALLRDAATDRLFDEMREMKCELKNPEKLKELCNRLIDRFAEIRKDVESMKITNSPDDIQMAAEHPDGTPQEAEPAEAEAAAPKPTRTRRPRKADGEGLS